MAHVLLVTSSTSHRSATRTKAAIEAGGHTCMLVSTADVGSVSLAGVGVIATVRISTSIWAWVSARWADGYPLLVGGAEDGARAGSTSGHASARFGLATSADTWDTGSSAYEPATLKSIASHPVTAGFVAGSNVVVTTGANWSVRALGTISGTVVGTVGTPGTPASEPGTYMSTVNAGDTIIGSAANAPGPVAPARAVFCGWLYAGQTDYTADGRTLIKNMIDWLAITSPPAATMTLAGATQRRAAAFVLDTPVDTSAVLTLAGATRRRAAVFVLDAGRVVSLAGQTQRREAEFEVVTTTTVVVDGATQRRVGSLSLVAMSGVILAGHTQRRAGTFAAATHPPVVPAPDSGGGGGSVVVAQAFGPVTMRGTQPVYTVSEAFIPRARQQIIVDGVDVTFFRDVHTPDVTYTLLEPLLYGPGALNLPQIAACFETPNFGIGELSWLRAGAPVEVRYVIDDPEGGPPVVAAIGGYKGFIVAFDTDGPELSVELGGEANGRAALRNRQVPIFPRVNDIGRQVAASMGDLGLPFEPQLGPVTGIKMMTTGGTGLLDHIQMLISKGWTRAGRQWSVMPDPHTGVYRMRRKDDETIHATVFVDDVRTVASLRRDAAEEPNRIFVSGVTPTGQRVRFGVYPGLVQGRAPEFPGRMVEGDSGPGVRMLILKLQAMGYLKLEDAAGGYDEDVVDAVVDLQRDAGLFDDGFTGTAVPGEVNLTTWRALYDLDVTGTSAETAHIEPAAQRSKVREWNRSGSGNIMGPNPRYDPAAIVVDRNIDMGAAGLNRSQMKEFARTELNDHGGSGDSNDPNWVGTITFNTGALVRGNKPIGATLAPGDVMDARALRPGMNIWAPGWGGGTLFHVAACQTTDGVVTATVDTRFRDAMEVWEVIARNVESRRDPSRSRARKHRASTITKDSIGEWDEIGGLLGNDVDLDPGWNVFPVVAAMEGTIARIRLQTAPATEFVVAVFGENIGRGALAALIGEPLTKEGTKRWSSEAVRNRLEQDYELLYVAGDNKQPCGYWPRRKGADGTGNAEAALTGKWDDSAGFAYRSRVRHMLWVAVWSGKASKIEAGRIMWPQLEAGV